ncbi:MAG: hypothetical protein M9886_09630 [Candidatus Nanopelagicales bacterium]|nr:hypothetical protein [Candidatus Nanopelagicales bacterium]
MARRRWRDDPLAVFRITSSTVVDSGRVEFTVSSATAAEEREVLHAVAGRGVQYGAFRYART